MTSNTGSDLKAKFRREDPHKTFSTPNQKEEDRERGRGRDRFKHKKRQPFADCESVNLTEDSTKFASATEARPFNSERKPAKGNVSRNNPSSERERQPEKHPERTKSGRGPLPVDHVRILPGKKGGKNQVLQVTSRSRSKTNTIRNCSPVSVEEATMQKKATRKQIHRNVSNSTAPSTQIPITDEGKGNSPHCGGAGSKFGANTYASALKQSAHSESVEKGKSKKKNKRKSHAGEKSHASSAVKNDKTLTETYDTLCFETLRSLSKKQPDDIVKYLASFPWFGDLRMFIKKEKIIPTDLFEVSLEIFSKASESIKRDDVNIVFSELQDSLLLLKHIPYHLGYMATRSPQNGISILSNAIKVLTVLVQKIPKCYESLPINVLKRAREKIQLSGTIIDEKILDAFNLLVEIHGDLSKPKQRNVKLQSTNSQGEFSKLPDQGPPPNDFRAIQILPKREDIFREDNPYLRENLVEGHYTDLEHYLDVHFRLLYEDFQAPLREGINVLVRRIEARKREPEKMAKKGIGRIDNVYVYEGVRILNPSCEQHGLVFRLTFDVSRFTKPGFWKTTKRLTHGSLLCLSKDNFENFFFATVADRQPEDLKKGKLDIKVMLNPHEKVNLDTDDVFLMAESRAYFEAYRHVLTRLQEIEELPFQQYLVDCKADVDPPAYLRSNNIEYDFSCICEGRSLRKKHRGGAVAPALEPERWPSASYLGLNDSQLKALETALTKELALIQGPPGTGKTYVGLKITKLLLENKRKTNLGPILVVCYTNHALDQFLEGIYRFQKTGIVRVGGRSSSEILKRCTLNDFVWRHRDKSESSLDDFENRLGEAKDELQTVVPNIKEVNQKLLPESLVREVVRRDLLESLVRDRDGSTPSYNEAILRWLNLFSDDAEINEAEVTVLWQSEDGKVFTTQPSEVGSVQLTERDFSVVGTVKTITGGGVISRSLRKPGISQRLYIDDKGCLTFEVTRDNKRKIFLKGTEHINDEEWHTVVMTYEQQGGRVCLYVDKMWQAEGDCTFYKYKGDKEKVLVGFNPYLDEQKFYEITIKELLYLPNVLSIYDVDNSEEAKLRSDSEEVPVEYEADLIQNQRIIEGDHDAEGFQSQPRSKRSILDKILSGEKETDKTWTVVKNNKKELSKFETILKRELPRKDCMSVKDSERVRDVWKLKPKDRWQLYRRWIVAANKEYYWQMATKQVEYEDAIEALEDAKSSEAAELIKKFASVIGMTTTGAAKRPQLLKQIGARIVIVEEAAEVLESHIVTSLTRECEHLILIGDHKQLRPTPNVYDLVKYFNFDVSLFERMIKNGLHFECLKKQHRMRPEISLVSRHIYPDLEDHESVLSYENISGVKHNIFFVNHNRMEVAEEDTSSHVNKHEAKFLVALCKYFLQQGYKASEITILTPYTGQLREIQKCTRGVLPTPPPDEKNVRITSIDNYQGEENEIILLSLVRSNNRGNIGFVKIDNRVCVALSRAKKGLFCIGNMDMIRRKSKLWQEIVNDMDAQGLVGPTLTLCCQMHDDKRIEVETAEDFQHAPNGGCTRICNKELQCGHICRKPCHPVDQKHVNQYKCREPCQRIPCHLHPTRRCTSLCSEKCSLCKEMVTVILPKCEHEQEVFCHISHKNLSKIDCKVRCPKVLSCGHQCRNLCSIPCGPCPVSIRRPLPKCGHEVEMVCSENPEQFACESDCPEILPCGHPCSGKCSQPCGKCKIKTVKTLPACGHQLELPCYKDPSEVSCKSPCTKTLICGHPCTKLCSKPCNKVCNFQCSKVLNCGHPCPDLCSVPCRPCAVVTEVILPKCGHAVNIPCSQDPETAGCPYPCSIVLDCGHKCTGKCSERCIPCPKIVSKKMPGCGHVVNARCSAPLLCVLCQSPCERTLPECGHVCQKKCYEQCTPCMQTTMKTLPVCYHRVQVPCSQPASEVSCPLQCERILAECGHRCQKKCHEQCTPCIQKVYKTLPGCYHRVQAPCSIPASEVSCPIPCPKVLDCGHQCVKKCSQPCHPCQIIVTKEILPCKHKQKMPCSTRPEEVVCRSRCSKLLACGHPCTQNCREPCGPCVSKELVTKIVPSCGHKNKIPCFQDPSEFPCTQSRSMPLPCGHDKRVPCASKLQTFFCKRGCERRGNIKCGPDCGKCFAKMLKRLPCGHRAQVPCYKCKDATECVSCSSLFMKG